MTLIHEGEAGALGMSVDQATAASQGAYPATPCDASGRQRLAREPEESPERFRNVFDETPIGLALVDAELRFVRVNGALCQMLGYSAEELTGLSFPEVTPPEDVHQDVQLTRKLFAGEMPGYSLEKRYLTRRGRVMWGHLTASVMHHPPGSPTQVVVTVEDITERKEAEARLNHLALHDEMTGLANPVLAMDRLRQAQARAQRSGSLMAVLVLDLDHFKAVNDSLGHEAGDAALAEVAWRVETVLRPSDTAARLDSDQFLVCCEDLGHDEAEARVRATAVTERISTVVAEPVELEGGAVQLTASVGIALAGGSQFPPEVVVGHADAALCRAKERGRARHELFDGAVGRRAAVGDQARAGLQAALEGDELVVHYQPILDLRDGLIVGAEALVRWDHPERGLLLPEQFLDGAEQTGLIAEIDAWVLKQACRQLSVWRRTVAEDLVVAVNASARQLGRNQLTPRVAETLDETSLGPGTLDIELSERAFAQATGPALGELEGLRELGVRLGLDDFGTADASLTSLRRLPLDYVKVDSSFVAGLGARPDDAVIVEAVVDLTRALGLEVIAEGVEVPEQQTALQAMGCGLGQGWHLGRPQSASSFTALLTSRPPQGHP